MTRFDRRTFLGLSAVAGLTACTATPQSEGPTTSSAFPMSFDHAFGTTTLASAPQRVACVGAGSHDVCLMLGTVPIVMSVSTHANNDITPWFNDLLMETGGFFPERYIEEDPLPVKWFQELAPDVILAVNSVITAEDYANLSAIAPVIAYPDAPGNTDWRTLTTTVSRALGKEAEAAQLISEVGQHITSMQRNYDDYAGVSGLFFQYPEAPGADVLVAGSDTNPTRALREFGLTVSPGLETVERSTQLTPEATHLLPFETLRGIDTDLLFVSTPQKGWQDAASTDILAGDLGRDAGSVVYLVTPTDGYALMECSPLSLSWASRSIIPQIARSVHQLSVDD